MGKSRAGSLLIFADLSVHICRTALVLSGELSHVAPTMDCSTASGHAGPQQAGTGAWWLCGYVVCGGQVQGHRRLCSRGQGPPGVLRGGTEQPTCACWASGIMLQLGFHPCLPRFPATSMSLLHDHFRTSPRDPQLLPSLLSSTLCPGPEPCCFPQDPLMTVLIL